MNPVQVHKKDIYTILYQSFLDRKDFDIESELEQLILEASSENNYSFSNGLLGIGWLVSFFTKYKLLDGNADEVLYDFDDNIYKIVTKTIGSKEINIEEVLAQLLYFQQRLQNNMTQFNSNRKILLFECQKLLVEKIGNFLKNTSIEKFIVEKSAIILRLSYLTSTTLNEKEVEEIFYKTMDDLVSYFKIRRIVSVFEKEALLNTLFAAMQYKNPHWVVCLEDALGCIDLNTERFKFLLYLKDNFSEDGFLISNLSLPIYTENLSYLFFCVSNFKIKI